MKVKFLKKDKSGAFYLVEWKTGYIQFWEDWSQFLRPGNYNWLNFRPIWFETDYEEIAGDNLGIEFGIVGFNLRFQQFIRDNDKGREIKKDLKDIETMGETLKKEIKKLKNEITKLKVKLKSRDKVI